MVDSQTGSPEVTPCPRAGQHSFLRFLLNKETLKEETLGLSHLHGIGAACLACYPLEKKALQTHGQGGWGEWKAEKTGGRAGSSADLASGPEAQASGPSSGWLSAMDTASGLEAMPPL